MTNLPTQTRKNITLVVAPKLSSFCKKIGITWFASCWDIQSVKDLSDFKLPCYKLASASITDLELVKFISSLGSSTLVQARDGSSLKNYNGHSLHTSWISTTFMKIIKLLCGSNIVHYLKLNKRLSLHI